jgi:hypothetical protein
MSLFGAIQPVRFDPNPRPEDDPAAGGKGGFLSRATRRRLACLREAGEALAHLPGEGEALHGIMTGTYDLMHLIGVLLGAPGSPCLVMRIATLSLSPKNVREMAALLDAGRVRALDLLCSHFFFRHDRAVFEELLAEFRARGQRVAVARSHCKVVTVLLGDGRRYALEGSANLRTNKNLEQFCLTRDAALHDWYAAWLDGLVEKHEVHASDGPAAGSRGAPAPPAGRGVP